jgi:hypothetical protein
MLNFKHHHERCNEQNKRNEKEIVNEMEKEHEHENETNLRLKKESNFYVNFVSMWGSPSSLFEGFSSCLSFSTWCRLGSVTELPLTFYNSFYSIHNLISSPTHKSSCLGFFLLFFLCSEKYIFLLFYTFLYVSSFTRITSMMFWTNF